MAWIQNRAVTMTADAGMRRSYLRPNVEWISLDVHFLAVQKVNCDPQFYSLSMHFTGVTHDI